MTSVGDRVLDPGHVQHVQLGDASVPESLISRSATTFADVRRLGMEVVVQIVGVVSDRVGNVVD